MRALIYDKATSMTQLTSDANVFTRAFVSKNDILNFNANVYVFTIIRKIK